MASTVDEGPADAYLIGINRKKKFLRVMTTDYKIYWLAVKPEDVALVRELLDLVEAEDDC